MFFRHRGAIAYNSKTAGKKHLICNADEGDPGAFMDRAIIESDPHSLIEGMLIGAFAIGASDMTVYVRAEYPLAVKRLEKAIEAWDTAESPTAEIEAEYEAAWAAHKMAEAVMKEYKNLYTTLCKLETDLLHLAWAQNPECY